MEEEEEEEHERRQIMGKRRLIGGTPLFRSGKGGKEQACVGLWLLLMTAALLAATTLLTELAPPIEPQGPHGTGGHNMMRGLLFFFKSFL